TFVLAIPFLGVLAMAMFGLDERFAAPKTKPTSRRSFCEVGGTSGSYLSDPDGTPWQNVGIRQIEARLTPAAGGGRLQRGTRSGGSLHELAALPSYITEKIDP